MFHTHCLMQSLAIVLLGDFTFTIFQIRKLGTEEWLKSRVTQVDPAVRTQQCSAGSRMFSGKCSHPVLITSLWCRLGTCQHSILQMKKSNFSVTKWPAQAQSKKASELTVKTRALPHLQGFGATPAVRPGKHTQTCVPKCSLHSLLQSTSVPYHLY